MEKFNYIDAFSHAKITQNANKNVVLDILHEDMILSDYSKNKVYLSIQKNALYKMENGKVMKEYNVKLFKYNP